VVCDQQYPDLHKSNYTIYQAGLAQPNYSLCKWNGPQTNSNPGNEINEPYSPSSEIYILEASMESEEGEYHVKSYYKLTKCIL
jgi:hypothetical protein